MRKEIFTAIIVGILLGLVVTYGIYIANSTLIEKARGINPKTTTIPTPTPSPEASVTLTLTQPESNIVVDKPTIAIEGRTIPEAVITIVSENDEVITESDETGFFSYKIELVKGANTIEVTASDGVKLSETKSIDLVYSTNIELSEEE
ncbi:MAG: hypothetical protein ACOX6V_00570 [Patescibacteria group bacterium]|jgi:hypothetical protein